LAFFESRLASTRHETVWRAIALSDRQGLLRSFRRRDWLDSLRYHAQVWWGGAAATVAALVAAWLLQGPVSVATTRLAVSAPAEREDVAVQRLLVTAAAALDSPTARLAVLQAAGWKLVFPDLSPGRSLDVPEALRRLERQQSLQLGPDGVSVLVSAWHTTPVVARVVDDAMVDAVMTHVAASTAQPLAEARAARAKFSATLAAMDQRAATLSQSLTDLARDMVGALKATDIRSPSTEVADQGAALLAELQLKRVQVASKYQDSYPAVVALDEEIAKLRAVVGKEQRRSSVVRNAANPVFSALGEERKRIGAELETLNAHRVAMREQIAAIDRQIAATSAMTRAQLRPGGLRLSIGPDPRLLSLPLITVVGVSGTWLLQWLLMRQRHTLVTPLEAELVLGVPVLRCLDTEGVSTRLVEPPPWTLPSP
jgi:hypothetical protein